MDFSHLTKDNFLMYTIKEYTNPQCTNIEEFHEDLNRIKYIKRLLGRYDTKGILKDRLILNHIIVLNNVFGTHACSRILFYKIEPKFHSYLKSFLQFLNYLPVTIPETDLNKIPTNHQIIKTLKEI
jgi:hypothetical protein